MYRNAYQGKLLTVLFSCGSKPLNLWDVHVQDGYITKFLDTDLKAMVLEIGGTNVSTNYITCPKGKTAVLAIKLPFLVMIVKNLKKYFSFEVTILDESGAKRRFRIANFQSSTQILPMCTVMPIGLSEGWNQIQFNLSDFTKRAYKKQFIEVLRLKVNANIRVRRIYFAERLLPDDELPPEYKLFFPLGMRSRKAKEAVVTKSKEVLVEGPKVAEEEQQPPQAPPSEATEGPPESLQETEGWAGEQPVGEAEKSTKKGDETEKGEMVPGEREREPGEEERPPAEAEQPTEGQAAKEEQPPEEGQQPTKGEPTEEGEQPKGEPTAEEQSPAERQPAAEAETQTEAPEEQAERPEENEPLVETTQEVIEVPAPDQE